MIEGPGRRLSGLFRWRVFGLEIDTCRRCGGTLRIVASTEQPERIARILAQLERTAPSQPNQPRRPLGWGRPAAQARLP
jgi:hypothetical protein